MSAPTKYDREFPERAVRMYGGRLTEPGEPKLRLTGMSGRCWI